MDPRTGLNRLARANKPEREKVTPARGRAFCDLRPLNGPVLGVIPVEHLFARILVDIFLVPKTFALSVR